MHVRVTDNSGSHFKSRKMSSELHNINKKIKRIINDNKHNSADLEKIKELQRLKQKICDAMHTRKLNDDLQQLSESKDVGDLHKSIRQCLSQPVRKIYTFI